MLIGCIADDFTGASDVANTLARGMSTVQFVGVPTDPSPVECEAGVIALKTRSAPVGDAVKRSLQALEWLRSQGCRQYLFKYCSTFDSTPEGNIGPVAEALLDALGSAGAIVCPAFPATGRTVYQGHLFVGQRLLNESGLERHPLNPMTDPNLPRWLGMQAKGGVGMVPLGSVRAGPAAVRAAFERQVATGSRLVVVDAVDDRDLVTICEAAVDHKLVTGASGIALGMPENFRRAGLLGRGRQEAYSPTTGPGVVLSGSCSPVSQAQVEHYRQQHPALRVDPAAVMEGRQTVAQALQWAMSVIDAEPIIYSTAEPGQVGAVQETHGRKRVAAGLERFFSELAAGLVSRGVVRLVVGGGETSGAVAEGLNATTFFVGPEIDPGVPTLKVGSTLLRIALKSGNFGSIDFYERSLRALGKS